MNRSSLNLKSHSRRLRFLAAFVLFGLILVAWRADVIYRHSARTSTLPGDAGSPSTPSVGLRPVNATTEDPRVLEIMAKYRMGRKVASYIAQAKIQILDQTDTSVHFAVHFPDQTTLEEIATVAADPGYKLTPANQERTARTGGKTHSPKVRFKMLAPKAWAYTLQYHVPYSVLPPELQQKIRPASSQSSTAAQLFDLVPTVYADGGEAGGEAVISVIANYFAESFKTWEKVGHEWEEFENAKSLGADVPLAAVDLLEDGLTYRGWMDELGKLENCAKNPTNPLAQKASQDPNYQHEVMDQLNDAIGDVKSTAVPTLASDAAGYLSHFLPFGGGAVTTLVFSTQDEAVSEYAEGRIKEAEKYLVSCEDMPEPPEKNRGDGTITFHTRLEHYLDFDEYDRFVKGDFELVRDPSAGVGSPGAGFFKIRGTGEFKQRSKSSRYDTTGKCSAKAELSGNGSDLMGYRVLSIGSNMINGSGDCEQISHGRVFHTSNYADPGDVCKFTNVDLVNGGSYTTHPEAEPAWTAGTECILELRPRPK